MSDPTTATPDGAAPHAELAHDPGTIAPHAYIGEDPAVAEAAEAAIKAAGPQKSPADLARDAIYRRSAARRAEAGDESDAALAEGIKMLIEGPPPTPTNPDEVEYVPPVVEAARAALRGEAPQSAPPAKIPPTPLAQTPRFVTLKVDGQEFQVPEDQVFQAGIGTMQKERHADVRLQRVSQVEQLLALERWKLDDREREINSRATTPRGAATTTGAGDLPSGGQLDPAAMKKAFDALVDGDTEAAARATAGFIAEQVRLGRAAQAPEPAQPDPMASGAIASPWTEQEVAGANQFFADVYPNIAWNPAALNRAVARMTYEMQNPVNRIGRVPLATLAVRIGQEITQAMGPAAAQTPPPPPTNSAVDELSVRRTLAARIPVVPASSQVRSASPPAEAPPPSRSAVVQNMRKARGQGSFT